MSCFFSRETTHSGWNIHLGDELTFSFYCSWLWPNEWIPVLNAGEELFKGTAGIPCTKPGWNEWGESQPFLGTPRACVCKFCSGLADEGHSGCLGWNLMRHVALAQGQSGEHVGPVWGHTCLHLWAGTEPFFRRRMAASRPQAWSCGPPDGNVKATAALT